MMSDIKFKLADPQQVTDAMIDAVRNSPWHAAGPHGQFVPSLVRDIHLALSQIGVVMIQLDNGDSDHEGI